MKNIYKAKILKNIEIKNGIFDIVLDAAGIGKYARPGQFVSIYIDDGIHILPRPISICEILSNDSLRLMYRADGEGTKIISRKNNSDTLRILSPLGNGFKIPNDYNSIAIFGGGIGIPPLLELSKQIKINNSNSNIDVFLGYKSIDFLILEDEFKKIGNVFISTDDGSVGAFGNILQNFEKNKDDTKYDAIYACGPKAMLKSIANKFDSIPTFLSLEERMACTVGACLACVVDFKDGSKSRICIDGPVFESKELLL